jgi:hypothetical protein
MTFGGTLGEKPRNATTQWHRPSVCKVPRLGVTFVFFGNFRWLQINWSVFSIEM